MYYTIPFLIELQDSAAKGDVQIIAEARDDICRSLESGGVPIVQSYVPPLYITYRRSRSLGDPARWERLHDGERFYIENCQWTLNKASIMKIGDAFRRAAKRLRLSLRALARTTASRLWASRWARAARDVH